MGRENGTSLRVAVTGPTSEFGALLLPRLLADPRIGQLLTFGPRPVTGARLVHHRVDLTRWDVESELEAALSPAPVDVLYHLAFLQGRTRGAAFAHELEVIGSLHTLAAAVRSGVRHVVVPSTTVVYGARPGNPVLLNEDAPLHGCPGSRFVTDRVEVERQLMSFRRDHPTVGLTVLRFAPVLGPTVDNPATRYFRRPLVPTLLGFDPLWQAVHEEDARELLLRLLEAPVSGTFNVAAEDVLPLSSLIRLAGTLPLPLPPPLARAALRGLNGAGITATPSALLDYLHYSWVADGSRARAELGFRPRFGTREAAASVRS
ncbi:MAG TPA: NAD-dependent epimerase/dehydratase family protein [Myxococcaceae bacterium]